MSLKLEPRPRDQPAACSGCRRCSRSRSRWSTGFVLFAALGHDPLAALYHFFVAPLHQPLRPGRAGGQGDAADADRARPRGRLSRQCLEHRRRGPAHRRRDRRRRHRAAVRRQDGRLDPAADVLGRHPRRHGLGRDPGVARTRFSANEILVSLMLVYVATLLLSLLVYGPWKDPDGYNFPQPAVRRLRQLLPIVLGGTRLHLGVAGRARWSRVAGLGPAAPHDRRLPDQGRRPGARARRATPASAATA